jgi:hypothetical protein
VVSNFTRGGLVAAVAAVTLAWPSVGLADDPPVVTRAPDIEGQLIVGSTLHAVRGQVSGSADAATGYTWQRCSDEDFDDCSTISRATEDTYTLTNADAGYMMRVTLWAALGDDSSRKSSDLTGVVQAAGGGSGGGGAGGGGGGTTTTPQAPFTSVTPVNVGPAAAFPSKAKFLKPRPKITISGKYGAKSTKIKRFTVKAPKHTKVKITCKGKGKCVVRKTAVKSGRTSHVKRFERTLRVGTKLTVTVSRKGYVSNVTVITIRARHSPKRADSCLAPGKKKPQKCLA